ncbi:MAG: RHS repeat-associated core domain-containing protein, partial [Ignavibacteriales bacterium]|nr:RHS repeat-associated core domain-containing protein [Ignavibacteriales bacterium]
MKRIHNPKYRFTGQEFDGQTGLYNFRARMYDADLGIFYGADPAGQGYAAYAYCGNNPVMRIDKDGKFFWMPVIIGAAIG